MTMHERKHVCEHFQVEMNFGPWKNSAIGNILSRDVAMRSSKRSQTFALRCCIICFNQVTLKLAPISPACHPRPLH